MHTLERLLRPKSIAVIGGGTWCANVVRECRNLGFDGQLWPVHPSRTEVGGCPAYPAISSLPGVPDAVFAGVNRHLTVTIIRELAAAGAGGAVCFASGFSEASGELEDGGDLQQKLVLAAGDMPILGPNCYGFINALDNTALWPDQHGLRPVPRGVAIIAQSSNIALNLTMQMRGLPIAYLVTAGNQAQTDLSKIGEALLADERVSAIGLHIEGIRDLDAFRRFAEKALEAGKPLAALKVGKSEQARAAAVSHTASLSGSAAGATALFRKLGIAEADSLPVLLEMLKLLHAAGPLSGSRIASMSCSGGEASLVSDMADGRSISFPALNSSQKAELRAVLGPKVALANPLDYHTYIWGDTDAMGRTFAAMMSGEASLGLVVLDFPRPDRCSDTEWHKVIEAIDFAQNVSGKPVAVVSSLQETLPETIAVDLINRGIVPLCGLQEALTAIEAVAWTDFARTSRPVHIPGAIHEPLLLSEAEAKSKLRQSGIKIPRNAAAPSAREAAALAGAIGFPVVLKGAGLTHKSEAGAVVLNLKSADDVLSAADGMCADGFLVEEMISDALAELLIGIVRDPAHGYVLTLAAGGVLTELLQDSVTLVLPVTRAGIETALKELKIAPMLVGYRGKPACDRKAIIDTVLALQAFVLSAPVEEVEINPLLCGKDFAIAADALIRIGETHDG